MENFDIYKDIAERTQGDIYVGVVGPVRTGKSTFIKRFMDLMVIPNIDNPHKQERAKDELPQSASGKSIHTTEPKFVPNEAVEISFDEATKFKVRMVDCVGYIVKEALGYKEGAEPKMVHTPWYDYEIPFEEAAEIGTRKVINEHSTIGIVVTTDGSITGIRREAYVEAEERVVNELKAINKPFILVLNTRNSGSPEVQELKVQMEEKYDVPVQVMDVMNMGEKDITAIFEKVLIEFPIKEINIDMPEWIEKLAPGHWLKDDFMLVVKDMCKNIFKVRDIKAAVGECGEIQSLDMPKIHEVNMGEGTAKINLLPKQGLFYKVLSEECNYEIKGESELLAIMQEFHKAKVEYDKIKVAIEDVKATGYGLVPPQLDEMRLEEPEFNNKNGRYEIKLKASAPSLHMIKANIQTEVTPLMGTPRQSEELYKSMLEQFENDPSEIWQSNMFGRSLETLVKEGLQKKLYKMPEDVQMKLQRTLEKIINEGNGGLICIIL